MVNPSVIIERLLPTLAGLDYPEIKVNRVIAIDAPVKDYLRINKILDDLLTAGGFMDREIELQPVRGTAKTLVELLQDEKGHIIPLDPQEDVKNAIPIEIINPRVFFDKFETFIEAWRLMLSGMGGVQAVKEATRITGIEMAVSTFYYRRKKWAANIKHFRRSYWAALARLPFRSEDDYFPMLIYHFKARPEQQTPYDRNFPYEFAGLCSRCREWIFGLIYPDIDKHGFCAMNTKLGMKTEAKDKFACSCGHRIEFNPHLLDWGK